MKYIRVNENEPEVPESLRRAVWTLRRLLSIDPELITSLLDFGKNINNDKALALERIEPRLMVLDNGEYQDPTLRVLGLIASLVNTSDYRLFAQYENDTPPSGNITDFGVFHLGYERKIPAHDRVGSDADCG